MKIGIIGNGAIGRYVQDQLAVRGLMPAVMLLRPGRLADVGDGTGTPLRVATAHDVPADTDVMIDCAGHAPLAQHGPDLLARGIDVITVSLGALADTALHADLQRAAQAGGARLHLASGAIGALDCLQAARIGGLTEVTYTGRKPPVGWKGSPAEARLASDGLTLDGLTGPVVHFDGNARQAAIDYPKNANVAAAVALAGIGFDQTRVRLIADPAVDANIHEIHATGDFGSFSFQIQGRALPDNPRSSALAAMSVVAAIEKQRAVVII